MIRRNILSDFLAIPQKERSCGSCSMCCKFFSIPEVNKHPNEWCQHCRPGKGGCAIYADRPKVCSEFECWWKSDLVDDEWYPARSKMVLLASPARPP